MVATFSLLFHRNWAIERAQWRRILFEMIIVFILLFLILVNPIAHSKKLLYSRSELDSEDSIATHQLADIDILTRLTDSKGEKTKFVLAYSPKYTFAKGTADSVAKALQLNGTIGFETSEELQNSFDERTMLAAIVFLELEDNSKVPDILKVAIRFPSEFRTISSFMTEDRLWATRCSGVINEKRDNVRDEYTNQDIYIREGFLQVQHQIFLEWFHKLRNAKPSSYTEPHVEVNNIRLKVDDSSCSTVGISDIPSFLLYFLYLLSFLNVIRNTAMQLEDNVMVHQWQYGYTFKIQWFNVFLATLIRLLIIGIVVVISSFLFWSIQAGHMNILALICAFVFIILFTICLLLTAFLFAKLFINPTNAILFGFVIWIFNYAMFSILLERYWDVHGYYVMFILILFFNNQLPFGMQMIQRLIDFPEEITFKDILLLYVSVILCLVLYLVLLTVLQWRLPGYLLSRRVVSGKRRKVKEDDGRHLHFGRVPTWHNFEYGDVGSVEVMRLRHISTTHRDSDRKILKNISTRIYKGEIYVILGHFGAGKITLLRVIAGVKYPTRGSILFNGEDYHANFKKLRRFIDFRSKENGLSAYLTIEQTLSYHVRLKLGPNEGDRLDVEMGRWIGHLSSHIPNKNTLIGNLNYGTRRLISLCCALAGETKILLLEDPTIGLTIQETQIFWQILMKEKVERSIVMFTHSVSEAEHIADRIGILSVGVLEAAGTPFFLRTKFSNMVELVIIKKPHVPDQPITDYLQRFISGLEPENEIGDTLTYKIDADNRWALQRMLIHLDNDRKLLGIDNVRVISSEVSDIYMKLVTSFRLQQQVIPDVTQAFKYAVVSKKNLRRQQMRAMFYKKMIHTAPNVWPVIMIFTSFILIVIIARLAVVLSVPSERKNSIEVGFKGETSELANIPNISKCGYINIKSMAKTPSYKKANSISRTFKSSSFSCEKGTYKEDLKGKEELTSLGAVEASDEQALNAYLSTDTFHSAPMTLNLLHNIILKLSYPNKTSVMYVVKNNPLPTPLSMKINLLDNEIAHLNVPLAIGSILPLAVSVFILPLVEEQVYQLRVLQVLAGIGLEIYWGINLFWDLFTFFIYSVIFVIIVALAGIGGFGVEENVLLLLLLTVFGLAALPLTYLISMYANRSMVRAFLISVLFHGITGLVMYIVYWDVANSNVIFFYGASVSPGFSLLDGISNVYAQNMEQALCSSKCASQNYCTSDNMHEVIPHCQFDSYFKWADPGILPAITFMILIAFISLVAIFWIELHRKEKMFHSPKDLHKMRTLCLPIDDADVADVKIKIAEADMSKCKQSVFLVDQVEAKIPEKGTKIKTVSFALNKYMSMGIYGPRNAGKSHLGRQLVGIEGFSFGEIYVRGLDFKYDLDKVQTYVGYCPQHGGLLNELTPREHIRLLCMIRGVPEQKISEKIHDLSLMLNMTGWMHRKCNALTAEKRRKVNVALSLVAYNKILVLDEPTCGMPATTCREIWNILRYIRYCGKTIIFITNDEHECKVLADFIMVYQDNEMLAIGSLQYLRYKYSVGFYIEVRLIRDGATVQESEDNLRKDVENLFRFVTFLHSDSEMIDRVHNWFKFYVPVTHITFSLLYGAVEKNKVRLNIQDYSIYQVTMSNALMRIQDVRNEYKRNYPDSDSSPSQEVRRGKEDKLNEKEKKRRPNRLTNPETEREAKLFQLPRANRRVTK